MQPPCTREMQGGGGLNMNSLLNPSQISLQDHIFDPISAAQTDHDFLDQMFSSIPPTTCSWPDLNLTDLSDDTNGAAAAFNHFDESALLASKLQQHQISSGSGGPSAAAKVMILQQQLMMARGFDPSQGDVGGDNSVQSLFNGFGGSLHGGAPPSLHFPPPQGGTQSFNAQAQLAKPAPAGSGSTTASGAAAAANDQPRQRVRARRGKATDPHSIAERLRRERIAERMKALQELVPNGNKTDKASMLDEIIDYVKFLQLQVKVLSMSRLGGSAAVAPLLVADMSSEGGSGDGAQANGGSSNDGLTVTEHQVAKLMEEDMGSAMQYLQGKGLCLMPISLATAISTATCHSGRNAAATAAAAAIHGHRDGPTSPSMSILTVQSAAAANGGLDGLSSAKDAASVANQ